VLLGLLPLSAGTVTVDGRPPRRGSPVTGYVPQQRDFDLDLPVRGRDLVQFGVDGHRLGLPVTRSRQVDTAIAAVGASDYADAPVGLLSGGQQRRLRIAQALAGRPRLLLCEAAEARGVPVRRLGLVFLLVLALTVTGAAQVVGTLLVLSLAITPAAAAQRLSANPLVVAALSVAFALVSADGGLLASFGASSIKASVFITSISFAVYLAARLAGPVLRDRRHQAGRHAGPSRPAHPLHPSGPADTGTPQQPGRHVPTGLGWPSEPATPVSPSGERDTSWCSRKARRPPAADISPDVPHVPGAAQPPMPGSRGERTC